MSLRRRSVLFKLISPVTECDGKKLAAPKHGTTWLPVAGGELRKGHVILVEAGDGDSDRCRGDQRRSLR